MTDDYQRFLSVLETAKRVLITTHVRPDGDALGTSAAMALGLRQKGISADVLLLSHLPTKYAFVFEEHGISYVAGKDGPPEGFTLDPYDLLLVVDTGTWSQLPGMQALVENFPRPRLVLDHHLTQQDWATAKLVVTEAGAAAEIAAELLQTWGVPLTGSIASAIFLGLVTDTGWFQYSNTRPYTLRLAAILKEAGVDTDQLYQRLYQNERAARVLLQNRALQSMELLSDQRIAAVRVRADDFSATGANVPDTENLVNIPLQIRSVEVSTVMTEPLEPGPIRISFRSKGKVNVAKFAEQFGGGGHARAAGLKMAGPLDAVYQQVLSALQSALAAE